MGITPAERSAQQAQQLDAHLEDCPTCRAQVVAFEQSMESLKRHLSPPSPSESLEAFLARLPPPLPPRVPWWEHLRTWITPPIPVFGGVLACLLLLGIITLRQDDTRPAWDGQRGGGVELSDRWVELRVWAEGRSAPMRSGDRLNVGQGLRLMIITPGKGHLALFERDPNGRLTNLGRWYWEGPGPTELGPDRWYHPGPLTGDYSFVALRSSYPIPETADVRVALEGHRNDGWITLSDAPHIRIAFNGLDLALVGPAFFPTHPNDEEP